MSEQTAASDTTTATTAPNTRILPRTRGAASGILLVLLGAWGALAPFIGPTFNFSFTPDTAWKWTAARGWFEVLPGSVAFVAGLLLLFGRSRAVTLLGAWLGILAGGWFIIGPAIANELTLGSIGQPTGSNAGVRIAEVLTFFYGLGAIILFLAAAAFGRLSVVTLRDVRVAERRHAARLEAEELAAREAAERDESDREFAELHRVGRDRPRGGYEPQGGYGEQSGEQPAEQTATLPSTPGYGTQGGTQGETTQGYGNQGDSTQQFGPTSTSGQPTEGTDTGSGTGTGYHSALGYRQGEQPGDYTSPTYGRHDANARSTSGESRADTSREQPR